MRDNFLLLYVRMCRSMRTQWKEACASSSQGSSVHESSKSWKNIRIFKANIMRWFVYCFFNNCWRSTYVRRRIIYGDAWMDGQEQRANSESWHFSRWAQLGIFCVEIDLFLFDSIFVFQYYVLAWGFFFFKFFSPFLTSLFK